MKIAVHDGIFHADEVFALAALKKVHEVVEIVRSRDPKILAEVDLRVDVGGKNDPETGDFDHHQKGGAGSRENGIPYAGFGLVWKIFGPQVCGSQKVADAVEKRLVQPIDAADCGKNLFKPEIEGVVPMTLSLVINSFNLTWQEDPATAMAQFEKAIELAGVILEREIITAKAMVEAEEVVLNAISLAKENGKDYVVLGEKYVPWQEVLIPSSDAKFVLFKAPTGEWRVQAVNTALGCFDLRKKPPEAWLGKRDQDLVAVTGVEDAMFCHIAGFMAGAKSFEGAEKLVEMALAG